MISGSCVCAFFVIPVSFFQASRITIQVIIPHSHHKALIGKNGESVQEICSDFNVNVKFPDRPGANYVQNEKNLNGHAPVNGDAGASSESAR